MPSPLTTHVLDTSTGTPARGLAIRLSRWQGDELVELASGATNQDGRLPDLLPTDGLLAGRYRLVFATAAYFALSERPCFYPEVTIDFEVTVPTDHHHVPLLVSPFGFSTYRGS